MFGDVGFATFVLGYSFETADATVPTRDRTTMVFVKEGGKWRITHEYLSPIKLAEPGGLPGGWLPTLTFTLAFSTLYAHTSNRCG
jgi:hypothetical protein